MSSATLLCSKTDFRTFNISTFSGWLVQRNKHFHILHSLKVQNNIRIIYKCVVVNSIILFNLHFKLWFLSL